MPYIPKDFEEKLLVYEKQLLMFEAQKKLSDDEKFQQRLPRKTDLILQQNLINGVKKRKRLLIFTSID